MATSQVTIPQEQIADFCIKHHIRKLSVFGSVLRDDFRPDSDVDVLVQFERDYHATLLDLGGIQMELSDLLGRFVDLKTSGFSHESILPMVIASMQVEYERN